MFWPFFVYSKSTNIVHSYKKFLLIFQGTKICQTKGYIEKFMKARNHSNDFWKKFEVHNTCHRFILVKNIEFEICDKNFNITWARVNQN